VSAWILGLVLFAAVVIGVLHLGEIEEFVRVLDEMRPEWLLAAAALQCLTYVCAAAVWSLALARAGHPFPTRTLIPPALAMLFANQAFPSAGVSGSLLVVHALRRRHVPSNVVAGALLVGLITMYVALVVAVLAGLLILRAHGAVNTAVALLAAAFLLTAVAVSAGALWYPESTGLTIARRVQHVPLVGHFAHAVATMPRQMLRDRPLLIQAAGFQFAELLLDAATLQVMLIAVDVSLPAPAVFASFAIASAVAWVIPVPLGLGTFEGSLVSLLHVLGVPVEHALAATLLVRGFTLWLPMLPGLWYARQELWRPSLAGTPALPAPSHHDNRQYHA
jgi:uncharacterized protein (TIRG00374 family)